MGRELGKEKEKGNRSQKKTKLYRNPTANHSNSSATLPSHGLDGAMSEPYS